MSRAFFSAFGKRCHVQIWCLRQKVSPKNEGRISRAQSALEQVYQNFCANSREAGGLPRRGSFPKLFGFSHHKREGTQESGSCKAFQRLPVFSARGSWRSGG